MPYLVEDLSLSRMTDLKVSFSVCDMFGIDPS